jgi:hypothetical protein
MSVAIILDSGKSSRKALNYSRTIELDLPIRASSVVACDGRSFPNALENSNVAIRSRLGIVLPHGRFFERSRSELVTSAASLNVPSELFRANQLAALRAYWHEIAALTGAVVERSDPQPATHHSHAHHANSTHHTHHEHRIHHRALSNLLLLLMHFYVMLKLLI